MIFLKIANIRVKYFQFFFFQTKCETFITKKKGRN